MMMVVARRAVGIVLAVALPIAAMPVQAQAPAGPAYVTRVVEGDILYAEIGGRLEAVRYLGVNAPRIEHPSRGPEPFFDVAREANRRLVEGKWIRMFFEDEPRDRFGRLLAYVWVGDLFVNAALVHYGYGEAAASTSITRYGEFFRSLEAAARSEGRGLWRDRAAQAHHRPRPAMGTPEATEYEERAADASGGRVFSAPAPFVPTYAPTVSAPSVGVPAAPIPAPAPASPSYIPSRGSTTRK
jgi:micrococcal nuclease